MLLLLLVTRSAQADGTEPTKQECVAANEAAQDLRRAGKLHGAKQKLLVCMSNSCPKAVRDDCAQQLGEVEKALADADAESPKGVDTQGPQATGSRSPAQGDAGDSCAMQTDCKKGLRCDHDKCVKTDDEEGEPQRRFGFGLGFGGGAAGGTLRVIRELDDTGVTAEIIISSFEFAYYLPGEHAFNLYIPFFNNVIGWGLAKGFVWNMDGVFTFNIGSGDYRFLVGPGIGFTTLIGQIFSDGPGVAGIGLRIPSEVAFEFLWDRRTWGVKFAIRPWLEIATERIAPNSTANSTAGGIVGMIVFSRFSTRTASP
jgi:hypothetical protein